mgnify:CR=1 FL=1
MSFATGLFSFMGGASSQYREEIDTKKAGKAAAATAAEKIRQFNLEQLGEEEKRQFEVSKFQDELDIKKKTLAVSESLRDIKKTEVTNAHILFHLSYELP